ncbi:MAG TPA: arginine--tRNA ligase [Terriglobia bacterium]|nr:arginine--tRNA ligase [Terriglobia bacterium]
MYLDILEKVRLRFVDVVEELFGIHLEPPGLGFPPNVDLGEISITNCFELAKQLRQPPRKIAESVAARMLPIEGVERLSVAGAGYLNLYLDRAGLAASLFEARVAADQAEQDRAVRREFRPEAGKVLVEHTSINPNKAAHVGHLRNAVLGDTFARLLRFTGREVEVQNYIDNTGVQVADVAVGFVYLEKKSAVDVRALAEDPLVRFDYYCWDLYARVTQTYQQDYRLASRRADTLKAIEEGHGELATMAEVISTAIVRLHLETVQRLGIRYDLLVQESEILRLHFWKYAFALLQERGALRFEDSGKNKGCWVMSLASEGDAADAHEHENPSSESGAAETQEDDEQDVKIIVRSNGTVTYVGKDIAYHLWKFGLLGRDFGYEPFYEYSGGQRLWRTSTAPAPSDAPAFGRASAAYVVIDSRQSYLQRVVAAAFRELGYHDQAAHMHHFAYEFWNLSLDAAASLGIEPGPEDRQRGYVEISGRRGLGVKADDLIDAVIAKALAEVQERQMTSGAEEQQACARMIGVAALRYFLLKFTRRSTITFDFKDALAFEGETGPYLQYSVVRARNILRKFETDMCAGAGENPAALTEYLRAQMPVAALGQFLGGSEGKDFWELLLLAAQLEMTVQQAVTSEEPAVLAKCAFRLAQAFNNFYHRYRVLVEPEPKRRAFLLVLVTLASETLRRALALLGIEVPERM